MAENPKDDAVFNAIYDKELFLDESEFLRIRSPYCSDDSNGMPVDQTQSLTSAELEKRLRKIEWVNKWLKQEHQQHVKLISTLKQENKSLSEKNSQLKETTEKLSKDLTECTSSIQKSQKQLSICFQENCSQKQDLALLRIENQKLSQQVSSLKEKNNLLQKHLQTKHSVKDGHSLVSLMKGNSNIERDSEESQSLPDYLKVLGATVPLRKIDRLRSLEKSHSSPQFFPNQETVDEISNKLFKQLAKEKEELEHQYSQVAEVQKLSNSSIGKSSGTNSLDLSGLNLDNEDDETLLNYADHCIKEMVTLKQDATFINFTLKYLMHVMVKHFHKRKDDVTSVDNRRIAGIQFSRKTAAPNARIQQICSENSGLEYRDPPSDDVFILENLRKNNSQAKSSAGSFASRIVAGSAESIIMPKDKDDSSPRKQRPYSVDSPEIKESHQMPLLKITIPISTPNAQSYKETRRGSNEAVAGSLPQSTQLSTPDTYQDSSGIESLLTSTTIAKSPYSITSGLSPTNEQISSPEGEEDRICPMCEAVFPIPVPQEEFEKHVIGHFEVEEFELLDM